MPGPTVAIAHDYLTQLGGAERVVLSMLRAFPDAEVHTTLYDPERTYPELRQRVIHTSPLNRIAPLRREHRAALPLLPLASSAISIDADVVLCSSSAWAHGFRTRGAKVVYCHSPARYVYLPDQYLGDSRGGRALRPVLRAMHPALRAWDQRAAASADRYLANSRVVVDRVRSAYGIEAELLPAPHSMDVGAPQQPVELPWGADAGHHLLVSRLLPYKNVDVAVEAFRGLPEERLLVVGRGPLAQRLRQDAPSNVVVTGGLSDAQLRWAYAHAVALVAPSHEDYGLTPLEAAAFGVPTLALQAGGYLDTVLEGRSGYFFDEPTAQAVRSAVRRAAAHDWDAAAIRARAAEFSEAAFVRRLRAVVQLAYDQRQQ